MIHQRLAVGGGDERLPPGHVERVVLERDEVLRGGGRVHVRHERHGRARKVHRHRDAVLVRVVTDLLGFHQATRRRQIRMNHVHRARIDQLDEVLLQVDVLAGQQGDVDCVADLLERGGVLPRHHVFHPREAPLLHRAGELDAAVHGDVPVVIRGERHVHADHRADRADPIRQRPNALVRDLHSRERMRQQVAAPRDFARRHAEHPRLVLQQVDAEILLQEGQSPIHARLEAQALLFGILGLGGVGVEPYPVAELPAEHLPARHAPRLAGQIHHRHLDAADAPALS